MKKFRFGSLKFVAPIVAFGAVVIFAAGPVFAALGVCRTDPCVSLSNGVNITMWDNIYADPSQVVGVYYTLHVPKGVTSLNVGVDTPSLEHVSVVSDQPTGSYKTTTLVTTLTTLKTGKPNPKETVAPYIMQGSLRVATGKGVAGRAINMSYK